MLLTVYSFPGANCMMMALLWRSWHICSQPQAGVATGTRRGKRKEEKKKKKRTAMRSGCTLVLYPWAWSLPPSVTRSIDLEMGLDMEVQILASEVCRGQKEGKGKGKGRGKG